METDFLARRGIFRVYDPNRSTNDRNDTAAVRWLEMPHTSSEIRTQAPTVTRCPAISGTPAAFSNPNAGE